jgi:hypothetical protein
MSRIAVKTYFVDDHQIPTEPFPEQPTLLKGFAFEKPEQLGCGESTRDAFLRALEALGQLFGHAIVFLDMDFGEDVRNLLKPSAFKIFPSEHLLEANNELLPEAAGLLLLEKILLNENFTGGVIVISTINGWWFDKRESWLMPAAREQYLGRRITIEFETSMSATYKKKGYDAVARWKGGIA